MKDTNKKFLQAGTALFILNVTASALNYLCQLIMARVLSVEAFGTVNTIFSFMMIIAVPGTTLTMVVAKYYAGTDNKCDTGYLNKQRKNVWMLTVAVAIGLIILKEQLGQMLNIDDDIVLLMSFGLASMGFFQPLYSGVFSGKKRFVLVGVYSLFIPLYKIVAIFVAKICNPINNNRIYVFLIAMLAGTIGTAVYGMIKTRHIIDKNNNRTPKRIYTRDDFNTLILNISLMLYMNIDLLAVRYYCGTDESGLYSSVLLFGRIIYYFATTLGTILLPSVAGQNMSEIERQRKLNYTLLIMGGFTILCLFPLNIGKHFFVSILFGQEYISACKYMLYVSLIAIALSFYTIMVNYVVGVGRTKVATAIMIVIDIFLISFVLLLQNIEQILMSISVVGVIGALLIYIGQRRSQDEA